MNKRSLKVLEYDKIVEILTSFAVSSMAKESFNALEPMTSLSEINEKLDETSEAVNLTVKKGNIPLGELYDITSSLYLAKKGGMLTTKQILMVIYNLKVVKDVESFLRTEEEEYKYLNSIHDILVVLPNLISKVDRIILSEDEIADSASPKLKEIRREIRKSNDQIKTRLNSLIVSSDAKMFLQDAIVTIRDGRYVVPVKAEHRQRVNGIIHDQSQSGATLFIEPQAVVELNNKLRELEIAEKLEIEQILLDLSSNIAEHFSEILNNQKLLIELDFVFAKAKMAISMDAIRPEMNENNILFIKGARHPLIDKKNVVPIDVSIGDRYTTLVITGPNTGGKTVTLKTIGLLSMMAQSGLFIPCGEGSRIPIYSDIYSDIGDEQSIEQSLSTFSSHMRYTVQFVKEASIGSLVLLDELGAGTDPTEGAALGIAILESLKKSGATVVATTHYNELKKYAISEDGVENASMQFDVKTLSPTYKLLIGIPGKSNAFEISKKLGLDSSIIDRANELIERGDIEFEDVLSKIEEDTKKAELNRMESDSILLQTRNKEAILERREELLEKKEIDTINNAKEEARKIVQDAKAFLTEVQKELRELNKIDSLGERNKRIADIKHKLSLEEKRFQTTIKKKENNNPVSIDDVKIGDKVKYLTIDQNGEVISLPDGSGNIQILVGSMKIKTNVSELMYVGDTVKEKANSRIKNAGEIRRTKALSVSASKNVIGKNLDDALMEVEKYLDDAYVSGISQVTIIHGRGEGILQNGIRKMLRGNRLVESYHKGSYNDGGDGVTVVNLIKE